MYRRRRYDHVCDPKQRGYDRGDEQVEKACRRIERILPGRGKGDFMLQSLHVKNLALIEEAEVDFVGG